MLLLQATNSNLFLEGKSIASLFKCNFSYMWHVVRSLCM